MERKLIEIFLKAEFSEAELARLQEEANNDNWVSLESYLLGKLYDALEID